MKQAVLVSIKEKLVRWKLETFKVNIDGSSSSSNQAGGWGFIVRDDAGIIQAAGAGKLTGTSNALHTELEGALATLRHVGDCGIVTAALQGLFWNPMHSIWWRF